MHPVCRHLSALAAMGLVAILCACSMPSSDPPKKTDTRTIDELAIRETSAEWAKAAAAKDLEKTLSFYADEGMMFPPNAPVVVGGEARRKMWTTMLSPADLVFSNAAAKIEASRAGDIAYETGTFEQSYKDAAGKPVKATGKYVVVWRKYPDGKWKAIIDIFNTDQ